jgi:molybdopterin converting factor small subunit
MAVVRYWAAARAAAGVAEESYDAPTLAAALSAAVAAHGPALERVLGVCSFLVDGEPVGTRDRAGIALTGDSVVEALPPFAGG